MKFVHVCAGCGVGYCPAAGGASPVFWVCRYSAPGNTHGQFSAQALSLLLLIARAFLCGTVLGKLACNRRR